MNYLRIINKGLIVAEDLMLIGSSTKREQTNKIGMFGSGWKYALSFLLRNDCKPIILSGNEEIVVDYNVVLHRDVPVRVITINGRETSLTTEMGPKWTAWMAIREIVSNAIDEGEYQINTEYNPVMKGQEDTTIIYVPMNDELATVLINFDSYFAFNRKPTFENSVGRVYLKKEKTQTNIYRKGIRCYNTEEKGLVDFDFNTIEINEDRLTQYYSVDSCIATLISDGVPSYILKAILLKEDCSCLPSTINSLILDNLKELLVQGEIFTTSLIKRTGGLFVSSPDALQIPQDWYMKLQELGLVASIFELFAGSNESFIRTDARDVAKINYLLSGFNIKVNIVSGKCNSNVFVNNEVAYINDTSSKTDEEIAALIIQKLPIKFYTNLMVV